MRKHHLFFSLLVISLLITSDIYSQDLLTCISLDRFAYLSDGLFLFFGQYVIIHIIKFHAIAVSHVFWLAAVSLEQFSSFELILILISVLLLVFTPSYLCINEWIKTRLVKEQRNRLVRIEEELKLLDGAKNKFISIMSHDLKDLLHTIKGYSYLLASKYGDFSEDERTGYSQEIYTSTEHAIRLLQNMMNWSLSRSGQMELWAEKFDLNELFDRILPFYEIAAKRKKVNLTYDFSDRMDVFADPNMIESVVRNLISNAIKFTSENGTIKISVRESEADYEICIEDSGIGISDTDAEKIFRIDSKIKYKGTDDEDGTGIGLILSKEFVEKNGGRISFESYKGKGSKFYFSLPRYFQPTDTAK